MVGTTDPRHRSIALIADGDQLARSRLRGTLAEDGHRGVPEGHRAESALPGPESGGGSSGPGGSSPDALRQAEMVRALRSYTHATNRPPERSDLNRVVRDTLLLVSHQLDGWPGVTASAELPGDLPPLRCRPRLGSRRAPALAGPGPQGRARGRPDHHSIRIRPADRPIHARSKPRGGGRFGVAWCGGR